MLKNILENARSKRNMLDFNFEKNMPKKLLNIFYSCYFDTKTQIFLNWQKQGVNTIISLLHNI